MFKSLFLVVMALATLCSIAVFAQQVPPPPPDGFVALDPSAVREQMPAAPLVIAAYSVAWVLLIGYLWSIWRRLAKVQQEIAQVSRRLESGSRPSSGRS
jgi:CcmD family protein